MTKPFITVVVASRNRPALLRLALASVMGQSFQNFELILVNDGSDEEHMPELKRICEQCSHKLRRIDLVRYPRGHGQSYSLNTGAFAAQGAFVTFLDDDDFWTDMEHLEKVQRALVKNSDAEVYYTNQLAVQAGLNHGELIWLGDLENICRDAGRRRENGVYRVDVELLMRSGGFAHLNCSVVKRDLFMRLQGMDEDIRWECDRDFYLRTIDNATGILFNPDVVSQHNVPDRNKKTNMTTAISAYQRLNYQLYVLNKALLESHQKPIIRHAKRHRVYVLQRITEILVHERRWREAFYFCREAWVLNASPKWLFNCLKLFGKRLVSGE